MRGVGTPERAAARASRASRRRRSSSGCSGGGPTARRRTRRRRRPTRTRGSRSCGRSWSSCGGRRSWRRPSCAVEARGRRRDAARAASAEEACAAARAERDALLRARDGAANEGLGGDAEQRRRAARSSFPYCGSRTRRCARRRRASAPPPTACGTNCGGCGPRSRTRATGSSRTCGARAEGAEKARQAAERDAAAWRRRVDALVAGGATRVDADEHRRVEEALRKAEDQCGDLRTRASQAAADARDEKNRCKALDAAWARDAARSAQRFLRDKRAEALNRRALDEARGGRGCWRTARPPPTPPRAP